MNYSSYLYILSPVCYLTPVVILALRAGGILESCGDFGRKHLAALAVIVVAGSCAGFFMVPHKFLVFYDEYEVYNVARMIEGGRGFAVCAEGTPEECETADLPVRPPGFSYLGAMAMKAGLGRGRGALFNLNAFLGALSIPAMFLLAAAATGRVFPALAAAFLTAVAPLHLMFSGNGSSEMSGFFYSVVFLCLLIVFIRREDKLSLAGCAAALAGLLLIRVEYAALAVLALFLVMANHPHKEWEWIAASVILTLLFLPLVEMYRNIWRGAHEAISTYNTTAIGTFIANGKLVISSYYLPVLYSFFAAIGIMRGTGGFRLKWWMAGCFLLMYAAISFPGVQMFGDHSRLLLGLMVPGVVLCAAGIERTVCELRDGRLRVLAVCVLCAAFIAYYPRAFSAPAVALGKQDAFFERSLPGIPEECSVFAVGTSLPMAFVENRSYGIGRLMDEGFMESHGECRIFLKDYFCATSGKDFCGRALERFSVKKLSGERIEGGILDFDAEILLIE